MAKEQDILPHDDGAMDRRRGSNGALFFATLLLLGCSLGANLWLGSEVIELQQQVREAGVHVALSQRRPDLRIRKGNEIEGDVIGHSGTAREMEGPDKPNASPTLFSPNSPVVQLTKDCFGTLIKALPRDKPVFINFYTSWCVWSQRLVPEYEKLAHIVSKQDAVIAAVDCTDQAELCRTERILAFPSLILYLGGKPVMPHYKMDRKAEIMKDFIFASTRNHISSHKPSTYLREARGDSVAALTVRGRDGPAGTEEESTDSSSPGSTVVKLTKNTFDAVVKYKSNNKPVFVNYYAPWAVWCQRLAPEYHKLAQIVPSNEAIIASVNCTDQAELCRDKRIRAFPTLVLYLDGGNTIMSSYKGDRTAMAMKRYIVEKSRYNFSVSASSSSASVPDVPIKSVGLPAQRLRAVASAHPVIVSVAKEIELDSRKIPEHYPEDVEEAHSADSEDDREAIVADDAPIATSSYDEGSASEEDPCEDDQIAARFNWGSGNGSHLIDSDDDASANGDRDDYASGSVSHFSGSGDDASDGEVRVIGDFASGSGDDARSFSASASASGDDVSGSSGEEVRFIGGFASGSGDGASGSSGEEVRGGKFRVIGSFASGSGDYPRYFSASGSGSGDYPRYFSASASGSGDDARGGEVRVIGDFSSGSGDYPKSYSASGSDSGDPVTGDVSGSGDHYRSYPSDGTSGNGDAAISFLE